jgi:Na+/melibiose symporter-like transporter
METQSMYDQNVLHMQWLCLAVFGGIILVLAFMLSILEYWRPRETQTVEVGEEAPVRDKWKAAGSIIPLILILTYALSFLLTAVYTVAKIISPPNW